MKNFFRGKRLGFYLTLAAACIAFVGGVAYLSAYAVTADAVTGEWDRVFRWTVFGFALGGALVSLCGEFLQLRFVPIVSTVLYGIAFAMHLVEMAYPLADILTSVRFFGGDPFLAILFAIWFGIAAVIQVVASFMEHSKER